MKSGDEIKGYPLVAGHRGCQGCGQALAARIALKAAGRKVVLVNATGCLEVFTTAYPYSAWTVPWIHSLFENTAAVASGVDAAYRAMGKDNAVIIAQAGDGGTADIGIQAISGMFERRHPILFICYDNEAYMNTGIQRSGLTPLYAYTSTTPTGKASLGNVSTKKDMIQIALAHGVPYVASATIAYYRDLEKKVQKAVRVMGPRYLHLHAPCPLGWDYDPALTVKISRLAVQTGLFPLVEYENGQLVSVRKISKKLPVEEYLKLQGRFHHLFDSEEGKKAIARIQAIADANIAHYPLM